MDAEGNTILDIRKIISIHDTVFSRQVPPTVPNREILCSHSVIYSSSHQEPDIYWEMSQPVSHDLFPTQRRCVIHV